MFFLSRKCLSRTTLCIKVCMALPALFAATVPLHADEGAPSVRLSTRLIPPSNKVVVGETFDLDIEISYPTGGEPFITEEPPLLHLPDRLELVGNAAGKGTGAKEEPSTGNFFFRYTMKAIAPGETILPSLSIRYRLGENGVPEILRSGQLTINIRPASILTRLNSWGPWILSISAVGVAVYACIRSGKKVSSPPRSSVPSVQPAPQTDPLSKAKRFRLEGDVRECIAEISRAVTSALSNRYSFGEPLRPNNIRRLLEEAEPDSGLREQTAGLLEECESLRYSPGLPPDHEIDRLERTAKEIINR